MLQIKAEVSKLLLTVVQCVCVCVCVCVPLCPSEYIRKTMSVRYS